MNKLDQQISVDRELGGAAVNLLAAVVEQARKDKRNRSTSAKTKYEAEAFLKWARKELGQ